MDNLTTITAQNKPYVAVHFLHVFRHVDTENLQSKATSSLPSLIFSGNQAVDAFARGTAPQAKAPESGKQSSVSGAKWIA